MSHLLQELVSNECNYRDAHMPNGSSFSIGLIKMFLSSFHFIVKSGILAYNS